VREGVYQAGHSCLRKQPYTKGPSSWDYCHVLQYKDGHRTLLPCVEKGERRARRAA